MDLRLPKAILDVLKNCLEDYKLKVYNEEDDIRVDEEKPYDERIEDIITKNINTGE